ncbi:MAG: hypothetical protein M3Q06_03185 [Bacteroidota bacterium]|nr:hypothetical protein [Bacteroidota bacterium]
MDNQDNIKDELRSLNSGLPSSENPNPFSVPEGYFSGLAASILAKVKGQENSVASELQELSPLLAGLSKEMPYAVPQGYFEQTLSDLPALTSDQRSAVLDSIGKNLPYAVPEGYFDRLPQQIMANLVRPKAKLVPFFSRTWAKAAAAAAVIGVLIIGGIKLLKPSGNEPSVATTSPIRDTADRLMAQNENAAVTKAIQSASTEEIDAFIRNVPFNPAKLQKDATPSAAQGEVEKLLKDVSASEIDAFLEQLPTADEDLTVID